MSNFPLLNFFSDLILRNVSNAVTQCFFYSDQTAKFIVNTVNAGSGALSVTVEGPSKVKLECREVDDGYEFSYNPTAPGDYLITIKYAGTNIAGSPYKARIEGNVFTIFCKESFNFTKSSVI